MAVVTQVPWSCSCWFFTTLEPGCCADMGVSLNGGGPPQKKTK